MLNRSNNIKRVFVRSYSSFVQPGKFKVEHNETIANRLKSACTNFAYSDAISIPDHKNYTLTYEDILYNVQGLASGFAEYEIKKDSVVVSNASGINGALTYLGATTAGLTYVPIPESTNISDLAVHLEKKQANTLILADNLEKKPVHKISMEFGIHEEEEESLEQLLDFFPNLKTIYRDEYFRDNRYPALRHIFSMGDKDEPGIGLLKDIILDSDKFPYDDVTNNQISTSYPVNDKYVSFTQKSVLNTADALAEFFDIKQGQRFSLAAPFAQSVASVFNLSCLLRGAFIAHISKITPKNIINTIVKDKCEVVIISGSNLDTLVNSQEFSKLDSLQLKKLIIIGEYDQSSVSKFESRCKTETVNIPVVSNQILGFVVSSSSGVKLLPNVEAKLVDGVLMTKGYHVANGEWLNTGVKATLSKDGSIRL